LLPNHLPPRKDNHTSRLVAVGIIISVAFSAIVGGIVWESRDNDHQRVQQAAANIVTSLGSEIDRNLELYDLSLQAVVDGVKLPGVWQLSPEMRQLMLFDRAATAKDMGSIFVLDRIGTVILDSRTLTPIAANHADRDYFKVQADVTGAGPYLSRPWRAPDGEGLIAISRRLTTADGEFFGVVVGTLRLDYFQKLFSKLRMSDRDSLTLTREGGAVVMRFPFSDATIGQSFAASPIFKKISVGNSGSFDYVSLLDGINRLYVYQRVGNQPLTLNFGSSIDAMYAAWRQKAWSIGALVALLCGINLALVVFLTRALRSRSKAEQKLAVMATTDGLTGLCNRRRLDEVFDSEWRRALRNERPVALLMIDADHFKAYNDQFGHQAGDAALTAIAHCIEGQARRASDICARYGGEEFAVLLPETTLAGAAALAGTIRESLLALRADQQGRPDSTPTVSIGVASMMPREGLQPRDLVKAADTALYEAKSKGRNRIEPEVQAADNFDRQAAA
jgi:diguanylate cyclase (GGDEF)-like protein